MQDPVRVEVGHSRAELEKKGFGFGGEEGFGHVFEEGAEVMFEEIEDKEYAIFPC